MINREGGTNAKDASDQKQGSVDDTLTPVSRVEVTIQEDLYGLHSGVRNQKGRKKSSNEGSEAPNGIGKETILRNPTRAGPSCRMLIHQILRQGQITSKKSP